MTSLAAHLDEVPKPIWIALAALAFFVWWPLGLALLACLLWSGKMGCCGMGFGNWGVGAHGRGTMWSAREPTSGNQAFDEYRAATLRRLEEEQRAFGDFVVRLRAAKDRAEFDQFMAERTARSGPQV